jgi:hypothetical protein
MPDLLATQRMHARLSILGSPHMQRCRPAELNLGPFQVADFRCPQAMPEGDQDQRCVTVTVATIPGGLDQLLDLGRRQVFARP